MKDFQEADQILFEAIEAYRNGDGAKATFIYESTKKYTYKVIHQEVARYKSQSILTGDEISVTEDIMQDLYIEFFNKIEKFRNEDPRSIFKWISVVSHRMLSDYVDKNKMEVLQFEKDEDYREDNDIWDSSEINDSDMESNHELLPEAALEDKEFRELILDFIQSLPEAQAQTILLHFRGGMKYQEIADEMGVSLITVKTRMKKAKDSLEEIITKYEKKTGTKLHSVSILPLLWLLYRMSAESTTVPVAIDTAVEGSLAGASGTAVGSVATASVTKAIGTRVLIGIVSATVVIGGAVVGSQFVEKEPVEEQQVSEDIEDEVMEDEVAESESNDSSEVNVSETETNTETENSNQAEVLPDENVQPESTEPIENNTVTVAAKGTKENPYKIGEKIVITDDIVYSPSVLNSTDTFQFEITITEYTPVKETESAYVESVGLTYSLNIIKATAKMIGSSTESYTQFPVLLALIDSDKTACFMSNPQAYDGTPMLELYNNVEYDFGFHIPHDAWYDENKVYTYVQLMYYLSDGTAKQIYVKLE